MKVSPKDIFSEIEFTKEQMSAITSPIDEAVKIVAGAGTGKTTVLVCRYLYLVLERDIKPENILALTFTKKAGYNLKKKVSEVIVDEYEMLKANIYNFDSFWLRMILENPNESGIDADFVVMDTTDRRILREEIIDEMIKGTDKDFILKMNNVNLTNIMKILSQGFDIIEKAKIKLINESDFKRIVFEKINQNKKEFKEDGTFQTETEYAELFSKLYENYQKKIIQKKILDFSDIMIKVYYLLKNNRNILERYRKKFKYILIDEMQDTSYAQFEILKLLSEDGFKNVTVVGDDKQSIFGWRDAEIENIRVFSGKELPLTHNFRSYNEILDIANFTIFQDEYFSERRNKHEIRNILKGYKDDLTIKMFYSENRENEAEFVADEIISLVNGGVSLNDIVVIFRAKTYPRIFEEIFRKKGIPFHSIGGGYFDKEEIKDVIAYLTIIENPFDISSLGRILENNPYPLNLDSMMKISDIIQELKEVNNEYLDVFKVFESVKEDKEISEYAKNKVTKLDRLFRDFSRKKDELSLANLIYNFLEESEYFKMCYMGDETTVRNRMNIIKNIYLMSQLFERKYKNPSIYDFVKYLEYKNEDEIGDDLLIDETDKESISLLTIHKAKGLEFDYVFFCDIRDKVSHRGEGRILLDIERERNNEKKIFSGYGIVLKYKNDFIGRKSGETEKYNKAIERLKLKEKEELEEIRLKYVAITRAKKMLYLTTTLKKDKLSEYYKMIKENFEGKKFVKVINEIDEKNREEKKLECIKKVSDETSVEESVKKLLEVCSKRDFEIRTRQKRKILKLDFSMIKEYSHCPLRFKYIYEYKYPVYRVSLTKKEIDKIDEIESEDRYAGLIFGMCIHRVLENYYNLVEKPEIFLKRLMYGYGIGERNYEEKYKERGEKIFDNFRKFGLDKVIPVYREKEFNLWFSDFGDYDIHFKGYIDRVDKKEMGWEIADYKTGLKGTTKNIKDDELQMQIYDLAVYEGVFKNVLNPNLVIYFLEEGKIHFVQKNLSIEDIILSTAQNIVEKRFEVDEELHKKRDCWNCEFGGMTGFCKKNLILLRKM
jgi:DNA helicase-2/ATP-dependent DNA helicase PcrA